MTPSQILDTIDIITASASKVEDIIYDQIK